MDWYNWCEIDGIKNIILIFIKNVDSILNSVYDGTFEDQCCKYYDPKLI